MKIAIIDTNYFINGKIGTQNYEIGYITPEIQQEIRDSAAKTILNTNMGKIMVRRPQPQFLEEVTEKATGLNWNLSNADISIVALCVEIKNEEFDTWIESSREICCLSDDKGVLYALSSFGIHQMNESSERVFKFRCYACFEIFDQKMDFCKKCGYSTITRVSVSEDKNGLRVYLKKDFKIKHKFLKDSKGREIKSADQKEYFMYCKKNAKKDKKFKKAMTGFD